MAEYAQQSPGLNHVGYRYGVPNLVVKQPEVVKHLLTVRFRTAVVTNRVVYVGNVQKTNQKGEVTVEGDAMYKSSVNKFDTFADFRKIEASIADGDEIIKLEEFADRILQFKKKKMHLINVSQEIEFLEETFLHKGVPHPAAVCKTDYGIAWVNKQGCYVYDGRKVDNLLEKGGRQIIKESEWDTFTSNEPMIGYLPKKRQLIVVDSISSGGNVFLYDMVTQSWVKGDSVVHSLGKTNFITDSNGDLVFAAVTGQGYFYKWEDASSDSTPTPIVDIKTKDIDFGQPGQRKKIHKVDITYKGTGNLPTPDFDVDGGTSFDKSFSETLESSLEWKTSSLTPSSPSAVGNVYSFQFRLSGSAGTDFEVNDISIVYRLKPVK